MVGYAAMIVGLGSPPLSRAKIITSDMHEKRTCSRSRLHGLTLIQRQFYVSRYSSFAYRSRICCRKQESGHEKLTSVDYAPAGASPSRTSSDPTNFLLENKTACQSNSILNINDLIISNHGNLEEPLMFQPVDSTLERKKLGLSEDIVRRISEENNEPEWMLQFRLDAFRQLLTMDEPQGAQCPPIDLHAMFTSAGASKHEISRSQHDLVDEAAVTELDSFATVHKNALQGTRVIFCSISDAIRDHPELVRKYLGKVVPPSDNFYAALNSAIFVDGIFCYVPENVVCPMDISTYFLVGGRKMTSPFERTLIVCDRNAFVRSLGCTSPPPSQADGVISDSGQELHAPVIELFCAAGAEIKHVTVQNWLALGAETASDDVAAQEELLCNFVTQRGLCEGAGAKIAWTVVEAGSGVTWQHPAVVLKGEGSVGECFSVTLTNARQQADTGATMIHCGSGTRSRIVSKTISAGWSRSCFRGVVHVEPWSRNVRSEVERDAILIGEYAESTSCLSAVARNGSAQIEEKGSTSSVNMEQVFFFRQRGIVGEEAVPAILTGFCDAVLRELPHEFESEVREMVFAKIGEFLHES